MRRLKCFQVSGFTVEEVLDEFQGTGIGTDFQFYLNRQRPVDDMHGRGPVMLAGAEILAGSLSVEGRP